MMRIYFLSEANDQTNDMCFGTEFALLLNEEQTIPKKSENLTTARFEFTCATLNAVAVASDDESDNDHKNPHSSSNWGRRNKPEIRLIEKRLKEMVPSDQRKLFLQFKVNTERKEDSEFERITSMDIILEGEILKGLHSAMSLGKDEWLDLSLGVEFGGVSSATNSTNLMSTNGHDCIELRPQHLPGGVLDLGQYTSFNVKFNLNKKGVSFGRIHSSWTVSNLNLLVKQGDCSDCRKVEPSHATKLNMKLLEDGVGADVEILAKGNISFPAHGCILSAQSPVIDKMLNKDHFVEGVTRKINMTRWSPEEVKAFLIFLYYGGLDNAIKDASINLALFKMGEYYGVQDLQTNMRGLLLKRPARHFEVDTALTMFGSATLLNDPDLKRKAVDSLYLRPKEEITTSELFGEVFSSAMGKELFLSALTRF